MATRDSEQEQINKAKLVDPVAALERPFILPETTAEQTSVGATPVAATEVALDFTQGQIQNRMNFKVGDLELMCPQNASREVVDSPRVNRLPNTAVWFKGLANVRGNMTPVVDLGQALGIDKAAGKYPYLMIFGRGDDSVGVLIDEIPRNIMIGGTGKLTKPPSIARMLDNCVLAAYDINNKIRFDLDTSNLFKALTANLALA